MLSSSAQNYINNQGLFWNGKENHQSFTTDYCTLHLTSAV